LQDQQRASRISRFILAGDSLAKPKVVDQSGPKKATDRKKYGYDATTYTANPTLALDSLLTTLCSTIPVSIMPGCNDPAGVALPQQPIHTALFDKAKAFVPSTLECVTNPCWWEIDGIKVFGSSGQCIDDVYKYVDDDHIEGGRVGLLEKMLRWRHCAPTAPDTLCTYFYVIGLI
jgi:DNA polymerase delta subunit 2